jgi:hypothetical protein
MLRTVNQQNQRKTAPKGNLNPLGAFIWALSKLLFSCFSLIPAKLISWPSIQGAENSQFPGTPVKEESGRHLKDWIPSSAGMTT